MTPDDMAQLQEPFRSQNDLPYELQQTGQARPNVLFEAGMAMGCSLDRIIFVELGTLRPFSDIAGRHTVRLNTSSAARQELAQRLETAGCAGDPSGRDWHTEGDFDLQPASAQKPDNTPAQQGSAVRGRCLNFFSCQVYLNIIERDVLLTLFKRIESLSAKQIASELGTHIEVVELAFNSLHKKYMIRLYENTMGDDYKITSIGIETARNIISR
jgi:hypothetical protein